MKEIPKFKSEDEERQFWADHDSTEYVDWSRARRGVFPSLKPSTRTMSLRLPESMLEERIESELQKHAPEKIKS